MARPQTEHYVQGNKTMHELSFDEALSKLSSIPAFKKQFLSLPPPASFPARELVRRALREYCGFERPDRGRIIKAEEAQAYAKALTQTWASEITTKTQIKALQSCARFKKDFLARVLHTYHSPLTERQVVRNHIASLGQQDQKGLHIQEMNAIITHFKAHWGLEDHLVDSARYYGLTADSITADGAETNQKEIKKMSTLQLKTRTLLNGANADSMHDDELFDLISNTEREIKRMEEIENKPKKLEAKIAERRDEIKKLVNFIDTRKYAPTN